MSRLVFRLVIEQSDDGSMIVATAEREGEFFEGQGNLLSVAMENLADTFYEEGIEETLTSGAADDEDDA